MLSNACEADLRNGRNTLTMLYLQILEKRRILGINAQLKIHFLKLTIIIAQHIRCNLSEIVINGGN